MYAVGIDSMRPFCLVTCLSLTACASASGATSSDASAPNEETDGRAPPGLTDAEVEREAAWSNVVSDGSEERQDEGFVPNEAGIADATSLDPNRGVETLSPTEKGQLCDWMNAELGGYGQSFVCGGGLVTNAADQAACVKAIFTDGCRMTVDEFVMCVTALAPNHGCNAQYDICAPLYACYVFD